VIPPVELDVPLVTYKTVLATYGLLPSGLAVICLASICFAGSDSLNLPLEIPVISVDFLFSGFF